MSLVAAAQVPHRMSSMEAPGRTPLRRTAAGRDMSTSESSPTRRKRRLQLWWRQERACPKSGLGLLSAKL